MVVIIRNLQSKGIFFPFRMFFNPGNPQQQHGFPVHKNFDFAGKNTGTVSLMFRIPEGERTILRKNFHTVSRGSFKACGPIHTV